MSNWIFRLAAATDSLLVALEGLFHPAGLPLAGGHVQQMGAMFAMALVVSEVREILAHVR